MIILESERLLFRPHEPADLDSFCAMEMDPEFRRYVGGYARSREDAELRFPKGQRGKVADRLAVWAAVLKSNGQYVGRCGLYPHLKRGVGIVAGEATLSFYFGSEHWGMGLASEAGAAFVKLDGTNCSSPESLLLFRLKTAPQYISWRSSDSNLLPPSEVLIDPSSNLHWRIQGLGNGRLRNATGSVFDPDQSGTIPSVSPPIRKCDPANRLKSRDYR